MNAYVRTLPMPLLLALLFVGCTAPDDASVMPLKDGLRWQYGIETRLVEVGTTDPAAVYGDDLEIVQLPPRTLLDQRVVPQVWTRGDRVALRFLADAEDGVLLVARQSALDAAPVAPSGRQIVLPRPLTVGATWPGSHALALIEPLGAEVAVTAEVVARDAVVSTPAGTFEGCWRIVRRGESETLEVGDDSEGDVTRRIVFEETRWYAPGVGLVRMLRTERVERRWPNGAARVFEGQQGWQLREHADR